MFKRMPRKGAWITMVALGGAALGVGCAASEGGADGSAFGEARAGVRGARSASALREPFQCAGAGNVACPGSGSPEPQYLCTDDWRDECELGAGFECSGLCVGEAVQLCGGPNDLPCGPREVCVPDPSLPCAPPAEEPPACSVGVCVLAACDPELPCGDALTCVDGWLYPTTCGPSNCDAPIGLCDPWEECGPPPPCAAPPLECRYEGGGCINGAWTCGTLVCDDPPPPTDAQR
jgi:hypothetical protein